MHGCSGTRCELATADRGRPNGVSLREVSRENAGCKRASGLARAVHDDEVRGRAVDLRRQLEFSYSLRHTRYAGLFGASRFRSRGAWHIQTTNSRRGDDRLTRARSLAAQAPQPSLAASVVMEPVNARVRGIAGFVTRIFALLLTVAGGER